MILIVTGTLLSAGDEIRVTAQLTDAASGTLVWSHSTQTSIGNVFRLQDELTERVVNALSLPLTAREQRILRQDVPADPKAYEYYLRGNQFSHDPKQWDAARDLYLRCVEADPCYAPAWARLGRIHHVMAKYLTTGAREGLKRAEAAFRQALDLNPDLADRAQVLCAVGSRSRPRRRRHGAPCPAGAGSRGSGDICRPGQPVALLRLA